MTTHVATSDAIFCQIVAFHGLGLTSELNIPIYTWYTPASSNPHEGTRVTFSNPVLKITRNVRVHFTLIQTCPLLPLTRFSFV